MGNNRLKVLPPAHSGSVLSQETMQDITLSLFATQVVYNFTLSVCTLISLYNTLHNGLAIVA